MDCSGISVLCEAVRIKVFSVISEVVLHLCPLVLLRWGRGGGGGMPPHFCPILV